MTVGVSKKRVRVITQGVASSVEEETDVYVVNTTDANLQLATSSELSSSTDLTGNVTIGSDSNAQVLVGSGPNADVFIGNNGTSSTANIDSDSIYLGSTDGSHNMYIGRHNASTTDSIFIGTGPLSSVTIGSGIDGYGGVNSSALHVSSRTINIGQTTGNISAHTALTLRGRDINTMATEDYDLKAQGNVVLVANDDSLNGSGVRTYLSLGDGTASLAHTNSSNTIQANCSLSAGTATLFGLTLSKVDSDTAAVVESPDTIITGTNSLVCSSPSSYIKHVVAQTNPGNYGDTAYSISGDNAFTSQGVSNFNKGTITLKAAQVTTNLANTQINGYTLASQITMSPSSENPSNNIHARSASGILLRSNDAQLNSISSTNQSGYYLELNNKAELRAVNPEGSILGKVAVDNTSATMDSSGAISIGAGSTLGLTADTLIAIQSGTSTLITTTKGSIVLSANSDDATYGDISLGADNDVAVTATKGNITLNANSTDATLGDINLNSDNDVAVTTTKGNITLTANSTDSTKGDININADNDININSDTNAITCQELNISAFTDADNTVGEISMYSDGPVEILSGITKTGTDSTERRTGLLGGNNEIVLRRRVGTIAHTAGYGNGVNVPSDAGNRFYSSSGFYSGVGTSFGGNASATGYAPFTGVHMFDIQPDSNISIGDAVIVVNHTAMLTTTPNDKRCVGIVCEILENNRISVASVGDNECGQLKGFKVCNENGTISAGDLLTTSSTAGYLMKQSDDIMRSSTVGKSAVDVVFDNNNLAVDVYGFIYCG